MRRGLGEKRKRILAGWLALGAVITWIPGVVSARQSDRPPPRIDRPAITAWDEKSNAGAESVRAIVAAPRTNRGERDLVAALDRALALVQSVLAGPEPLDLDELARTWGGDAEHQAAASSRTPADHRTTAPSTTPVERDAPSTILPEKKD
jgi:hypothetical protein